ncbi:unnamed protein product [Timema podura]|uniref:Uncharacterized protein n=1 Tax=Timema podura TaxID=61482 RepID=A0ABN7PN55_TIMPD|nr:unnamed protein product [Timema podura]
MEVGQDNRRIGIGQHVKSILNRKKVYKEIIFKYLHQRNVDVVPSLEKKTLVNIILNFWQSEYTPRQVLNSQESASSTKLEESKISSCETVPYADELALKFSDWYFNLLNQSIQAGAGATLGTEHFWQDCNITIKMASASGTLEELVCSGASETVKLLCSTCSQNRLYFNPNLSQEGVRGRSDPHGVVAVLACGTLHTEQTCIGMFEQMFVLVRDVQALNNWKIKSTKLNLRSMAVTTLPTLEQGTFTKTLALSEAVDS